AQGNGGSEGSGDDPSAQAEGPETTAPAGVEELPPWERLAIGLERAWEKARGAILEQERPGSMMPESIPRPAARGEPGHRPGEGPAASRQRSAEAPGQSGTQTPSNPAALIDAAAGNSSASGGTSVPRPTPLAEVVDAALEGFAVEREMEGRPGRWKPAYLDQLAGTRHPAAIGGLIAVLTSTTAAGVAWQR